jgi:glycosyltransferase involved in cell wall biosynthesis
MRVSAYVPCYNERATVRDAVKSILDQTVPLDDVFVVDDGSIDGSAEIVGIRVVRIERNRGRGPTRARAMQEAKADLVLGCDATLKLSPSFLENALHWFKQDRVAAVFGEIRDESVALLGNRWRNRHIFRIDKVRCVQHFSSLSTSCSIVRKSAAEAVGGFNPDLRAAEDADLGDRLLRAGFDIVSDPELWASTTKKQSVWEVLERYARWNRSDRIGICDYLRQIVFSVKVMAMEDLRANDPASVFLSLLSPHYQLWYSFRLRSKRGVTRPSVARHKTDDRR